MAIVTFQFAPSNPSDTVDLTVQGTKVGTFSASQTFSGHFSQGGPYFFAAVLNGAPGDGCGIQVAQDDGTVLDTIPPANFTVPPGQNSRLAWGQFQVTA